MTVRWCAWSAAWLLSLLPGAALGEPATSALGPPEPAPDRVLVALPRCQRLPYDAADFLAALSLELAQRGIEARLLEGNVEAEPSPGSDVSVELPGCDPDALALHLLMATGREERSLPLHDIRFEARARALALLIAESLSTRAPSPAPTPRAPSKAASGGAAPPRAFAGPADAAEERSSVGSARSRARLGAALSARSTAGALEPLWGAEVNLRAPVLSSLEWVAEAAFARRTQETWLGDFGLRWWSLSGGLDGCSRGEIEWRLGPRVSLVRVSSHAEPRAGSRGASTSDALVLLGGRGAVGLPVGDSAWQVSLALDAQRALRGLQLYAGGTPSVALDGWLIGASVGLSRSL